MYLTNSLFLFVFGIWRSSFDFKFNYGVYANSNAKTRYEKISNSLYENQEYHDPKFVENDKKKLPNWPIIINTWPFTNATEMAWKTLKASNDRLDAVVAGCHVCEVLRCDGTVGYGGSPDESGETTLDALILDGPTSGAGSVAGLKRIKEAIAVARAVMDYTEHTLIVGDAATQFAIDMGFQQEDLHAIESLGTWINWFSNNCQPNFRKNVYPDAESSCGPYKPIDFTKVDRKHIKPKKKVDKPGHDTIGMVVIDENGDIAAGTSTNGASHKIPGRVGDSPIIGSGAYVDNDVGAACGTGDGDTLMRHLPAYQAVESMRNGMSPSDAAEDAIERIVRKEPNFNGAILVIDKYGNHGAACHGFDAFPYSFRDSKTDEVKIVRVSCI